MISGKAKLLRCALKKFSVSGINSAILQEIDGDRDGSVEVSRHCRDILQNAVFFHFEDVRRIDRLLEERRADD